MSTRGIVCIIKNKEYKVATYNHFDSYPEGLGIDILHFLSNKEKLNNLIKNIDNVKIVTNKMINDERILLSSNEENYQKLSFIEKSKIEEKVYQKYPVVEYDILNSIISNEYIYVKDSLLFAADSLFCEHGYVIDLDEMKLEVYSGFNKTPLNENERFFFLEKECNNDYKPIKFVNEFDINNLPDDNYFIEYSYKK